MEFPDLLWLPLDPWQCPRPGWSSLGWWKGFVFFPVGYWKISSQGQCKVFFSLRYWKVSFPLGWWKGFFSPLSLLTMLFPFQLIPPCLITTCCCKQPYLIFPGSSFQCCSMAESCEKGLGLSQSHSNSALDYSGDTFESFSEEEESQARCWCCTEDLGSSSSQAGQRPAVKFRINPSLKARAEIPWAGEPSHLGRFECGNPSEEESEAVERAATGKWMDVKNKDTGIRPDKFAITAPAAIPAFSPEELDALRSFCSSRISRMQQEQPGKCRKLQWKMPARKSESGNCCDVPAQLLNRILLENTRQAVKQVTEAEIHETSTCPECQHKEAELARAAFLRHKKNLLESALIQEKLEEHLYSRDMLTLLGEALRSLPKPSEDLWQKLKDQGMENQNQP